MSSIEQTLPHQEKAILLDVARRSITHGLKHGVPLELDLTTYPESLRFLRATFVTLEIQKRLRGCIGILEARLPLIQDVADHAYAAAFEDPRFPALTLDELALVEIHVSVLSPSEPIAFTSEDDLLIQLRPGLDGLILRLGQRRATFLPSVWETLTEPFIFLTQLKQKAGLPLDYWSEEIVAERYITDSFGEEDIAGWQNVEKPGIS